MPTLPRPPASRKDKLLPFTVVTTTAVPRKEFTPLPAYSCRGTIPQSFSRPRPHTISTVSHPAPSHPQQHSRYHSKATVWMGVRGTVYPGSQIKGLSLLAAHAYVEFCLPHTTARGAFVSPKNRTLSHSHTYTRRFPSSIDHLMEASCRGADVICLQILSLPDGNSSRGSRRKLEPSHPSSLYRNSTHANKETSYVEPAYRSQHAPVPAHHNHVRLGRCSWRRLTIMRVCCIMNTLFVTGCYCRSQWCQHAHHGSGRDGTRSPIRGNKVVGRGERCTVGDGTEAVVLVVRACWA